MRRAHRPVGLFLSLTLLAALGAGCSGDGAGPATPDSPGAQACSQAEAFDSTFDAIQKVVFERNGCTQDLCHGSAKNAGLDLRPDAAYDSIFDVPSSEQPSLKRVYPGDKTRSFLWLKLAAKTDPGSVEIVGAPMPNNLPAISADELEALRLWIYSGAPRTGTVPGTQQLLDACLPDPKPITIKPLDPPPPGQGVQMVLPSVNLPKNREQEICFATYYDVSDQVPAEFRDPTGNFFRFQAQELRQDPQSHHLTLNYSGISVDQIHDPSLGAWTCVNGEHAGATCEPTDLTSCGSGVCRSEPKPAVGCVGYGPPVAGTFLRIIAGAQQAQAFQQLQPGVFSQIPVRGIVYWNSHAFNLTNEDFVLNGRINFTFASDQRYPVAPILDIDHVFEPHAAPYTTETYCEKHVLPQGSRLFLLTSHNHKRGKHFWATAPDGSMLYENFIYNDPVKQHFDPPLAFDSPDAAERTLTYCGTYNNGVADDGSPDPEKVTRSSRIPESARISFGACKPVACAAGKVGAPCAGADDNASCDSAPGAGDGLCDACRITGGESTENEMFILIGSTFIAEGFPQPPTDDPIFGGPASARDAVDASGRSTYSGLAVPASFGCTGNAAPGAHAGHVMH